MTEKDPIKDLENQAKNTKQLMDRLNRAAYGLTFDEALRIGGKADAPDKMKEGENDE